MLLVLLIVAAALALVAAIAELMASDAERPTKHREMLTGVAVAAAVVTSIIALSGLLLSVAT